MGAVQSHHSHHSGSEKVAFSKPAPRARLTRKLSCVTAWSSQDSLTSSDSGFYSDDKPSVKSLFKAPESHGNSTSELNAAFADFLDTYPEYRKTWIVDSLRRSDFSRLDRSEETYVDYMGGALFPESLVQIHSDFLSHHVMGNTHSVSNSSQTSTIFADEARSAVLSYFNAPPGYTVIFTANATAALKLVGESYPFNEGGAFILGVDSHNSVNGIRRFASQAGAKVRYIRSASRGGLLLEHAEFVLEENKPRSHGSPCLFAMTGQSNITNSKNPLWLIQKARNLGYHTLLDAAALAPTSPISLSDLPVDAMAISFYKMFGFPTGVGALIVKEDFLRQLSRPWFAGGTVDVVQVPGSIVTMVHDVREQFEDGTINYLSLPAVTQGLRFLSTYLPFLPLRLSILVRYLVSELENLRHDYSDVPVVRILSRVPMKRLKDVGEQSDTGSTVSLLFLDINGFMLPNSFIEYAATRMKISLRTGCVCNPGGAAVILGIEDDMELIQPGITLKAFEEHVGHELGVVRISLGLASSFADVWKVLQFARCISRQEDRMRLFSEWQKGHIADGH